MSSDEDLDRSTPDKTSSVHFLRFELDPAMLGKLREGAAIAAGVEHELYNHRVDSVAAHLRDSLLRDLD